VKPYELPFRITEPVSNNIFSWERFQGRSIRVPACVDGTLADLAVGTETVFEDFDDAKKILRSCRGLANFVRTTWNGVPMAVVDNHNHALYFWYEARARGHFSTPVALVHVDEHSDKRAPHVALPADASPERAFAYANRDVNVGNFIQPRLDSGFFSSYEGVGDEAGCGRVLERLRSGSVAADARPARHPEEAAPRPTKDPDRRESEGNSTVGRDAPALRSVVGTDGILRAGGPQNDMPGSRIGTSPFVLDFDADFFSTNLDYMDWGLRVRAVRELARRASFITVATSPFFIEQERAIKVIREIFS
jgi:hypothetical protein